MRRGLLGLLVACGGSPATPDGSVDPVDAQVAPAFRHPVALPDAELAHQALQILGADVVGAHPSSCNACHGMTKQRVRYWRALSDTTMATCLTDLQVGSPQSALAMIDCVRELPEIAGSDFQTKKLGIYATAVRLPWFAYTFAVAYGDDGPQRLAELQSAAGMPKEDVASLTQAQFDIVAEWFARGVPNLDEALVTDPPPDTCDPGISSDVAAHVAEMATTGWTAVNRQTGMAMHGCGAATDPRDCLQDVPLASGQAFGAGWDLPGRGQLRVLADVDYVTSFWTRSSTDGRFIAHGVANVQGSYVIDLQRDVTVPINSAYDPAFFPDNSGFVFQGGPRNTCPISVLTSNPSSIAMTEPGCRRISQIGLYQHVGQALGGGDYFALDNEFQSDDGGKNPTLQDPDTSFGASAYLSFTPMIFDGTTYQPRTTVNLPTPFEGDSVLAASARLVISRVSGPGDRQLGYVLRKIVATPAGSSYTISAPEIARYCISGGKPGFSFDERWIAFHHYVTTADAIALGFTGPADPAFAPYLTEGAANLYLMELATGEITRITNLQPGQYALFPHFRSDGWLYAQVRDRNAAREYTVATDAALVVP